MRNFTYNDELYHAGVKGMKWRVRRKKRLPKSNSEMAYSGKDSNDFYKEFNGESKNNKKKKHFNTNVKTTDEDETTFDAEMGMINTQSDREYSNLRRQKRYSRIRGKKRLHSKIFKN